MDDSSGGLRGKDVLCSGRFVRLVSREGWEFAERMGATGVVVIVPVVENRLVLTEQFRRPVDARVIELPAGLVGDLPDAPAESFIDAARRELLEETGYEAAELTLLTEGPPSAGLTTEILTFFLATGLERAGPGGGDESEEIVVHEVPLDAVDEWLQEKSRSGVLVDPKIYAGLYFVRR